MFTTAMCEETKPISLHRVSKAHYILLKANFLTSEACKTTLNFQNTCVGNCHTLRAETFAK